MTDRSETDRVDNSLEAMRARLLVLQPSLEALMDKALNLFDDVYPQADHQRDCGDWPVYRTWSADLCPEKQVPMIRELTVVLGSGRWVRVFRGTDSLPSEYPRKHLWLWRPNDDNRRLTNVFHTHAPRRREFPFDVETADYNEAGTCQGFIGGGPYHEQEPFIEEADVAFDDAREVAEELGLVVPVG